MVRLYVCHGFSGPHSWQHPPGKTTTTKKHDASPGALGQLGGRCKELSGHCAATGSASQGVDSSGQQHMANTRNYGHTRPYHTIPHHTRPYLIFDVFFENEALQEEGSWFVHSTLWLCMKRSFFFFLNPTSWWTRTSLALNNWLCQFWNKYQISCRCFAAWNWWRTILCSGPSFSRYCTQRMLPGCHVLLSLEGIRRVFLNLAFVADCLKSSRTWSPWCGEHVAWQELNFTAVEFLPVTQWLAWNLRDTAGPETKRGRQVSWSPVVQCL